MALLYVITLCYYLSVFILILVGKYKNPAKKSLRFAAYQVFLTGFIYKGVIQYHPFINKVQFIAEFEIRLFCAKNHCTPYSQVG
jgi:hypothetical protein